MSYIDFVLNIIPTLHEGYIVSVHRMVMENRPVGPGKKLKSVSCEYDVFEWLKLNFASCVVHQTRSYNMVFVNYNKPTI